MKWGNLLPLVVWCLAEVNFIGLYRVTSFTATNRAQWNRDSTMSSCHPQAPTAPQVNAFADSNGIESLKKRVMKSLAGPYLIQSNEYQSIISENDTWTVTWSLIPLDAIQRDSNVTGSSSCKSAVAWSTLQSLDGTDVKAEPTSWLTATFAVRDNDLEVRHSSRSANQPPPPDKALVAVLSRVLVQHCLWSWYRQQRNQSADSIPASARTLKSTLLRLPNEEPRAVSLSCFAKNELELDEDNYTSFVRSLFQQMSVDTSNSEWVEMVHGFSGEDSASNNLWIGVVPRHWVHQCNLLHRGIGVLITKDRPIRFPCPSTWTQPDLYCHQRTATKRIFPSLYDMFVGGISLVGEEPKDTARREISEELGLNAAMEKDDGKLSDCLIRCVVCTAYNRCVVDVFGYVVDTATEQIVWQEEEVAWGAFVPYDIVRVAAEQSIRRLIEVHKWPGRYLPSTSSSLTGDPYTCELAGYTDSQWKQWDFVPDGLLVWESWIHAQTK